MSYLKNTSIFAGWIQFNDGMNDYRYEQSSGKFYVLCGDSYIYECTLKSGLKTPKAVQNAYDQAVDLEYRRVEQCFL